MYEHLSPARDSGPRILIASGDPGTAELLTTAMESAGYRAAPVGGAEAVSAIMRHACDLVVLDSSPRVIEEFIRWRRSATAARPPTLFLTTDDGIHRLLPELRVGTEDYVLKPVRTAEVLARVQGLLRDGHPARHDRAPSYGDLTLDDAACQAWRGPRALDLTPAEYRLLRHLLLNAGQVLSKEQISQHVWGDFRGGQAIEKLVSRLRHKVDQDRPALIHTRRGFGYWLGHSVLGRDPREPGTVLPAADREVREVAAPAGRS
ncbi:response regulator transcription factor [Streptomyces sp. NBC_00287]|uniref:response regulator transcription factor n=1 Tax=Streptomyces sp. NBC_00287 TaxID=2975702 RepID=UPI002E29C18C|nr:response regulator transcription factor [Streptomyces sp. NBC_00287]